jgi:S1-C subfamily serine protease
MDSFGVVSSRLKALAKKPALPAVVILEELDDNEVIDFIGARVKKLASPGERSATGMDDTRGLLVVEVISGSGAAGFLQANDVILSLNGVKVNKLRDLLEARRSVIGSGTEIVIFRNQQEIKMHIELNGN